MALAEHFKHATADIPAFPLLDRANYYIQHKVRVALRGNLYGIPGITTEAQEEIATRLLDSTQKGPGSLSIGHFCSVVREPQDGLQVLKILLEALSADTGPLGTGQEIVRSHVGWRRVLTLAHLGVYLIDFFQEFENTCRWEEERLFLTRLIVPWNADSVRHRYLYEPGDLSTNNYLDTYPGRLSSAGVVGTLTIGVLDLVGLRRPIERALKWADLNARGSRYRRRHDTKKIRPWGLRIETTGGTRDLRWRDDLQSLYGSVQNYIKTRLVSGA